MNSITPIEFKDNLLILIDQRKLFETEEYFVCDTVESVHFAIKDMVVRGAPLIGFTGIWGLALFLKNNPKAALPQFIQAGEYLKSARPTAVNLAFEIDRCIEMAKKETHLPNT